jgi:hypothetical protein
LLHGFEAGDAPGCPCADPIEILDGPMAAAISASTTFRLAANRAA